MANGLSWAVTVAIRGEICHLFQEQHLIDHAANRALFDGVHDFALFDLPNGTKACLQEDIPAAKDTISRIRTMESKFGAHIAFAHDTEWMKIGTDEVLMSLLDDTLKVAARETIPNGGIP